MTGTMKRILYLVLGLLAGAAVWGAEEAVLRFFSGGYLALTMLQGTLLGAIFGFAFGGAEGIAIGETRKAAVTAGTGFGIGALAGTAATILAALGLVAMANTLDADYGTVHGLLLPIFRALGWGLAGTVIGGVEGLRAASLRKTLVGLLSGLVGGIVGGVGLEIVLRAIPDAALGRAVGFLLLGLILGGSFGEFERRFSYGRLKVLTGPLKNKEYLLSRKRTRLGTAFTSDVYLAVYPESAVHHAVIRRESGEMSIEKGQGPVTVNEKPVEARRFLKYEDVLDLGGVKLLLLPL